MFELIYHSMALETLNATDIQDILVGARDFNARNDITGCLLYHNHRFIQILEGEERIIRQLFGSIERDRRHTNVMLLETGTKAVRLFDRWNMAFHQIADSEASKINKVIFVNNFKAFSEMTEKPTVTIRLFFDLARQMLKE